MPLRSLVRFAGRMPLRPRVNPWFSRKHWNERIICFNASWFTVTMGTGVVVQVLNNMPYYGSWLHTLGYCYWILSIFLFLLFTLFGTLRGMWYPRLSAKIVQDFYQASYLGAIPISLDAITVGITIYYNNCQAAILAAIVLFWIAVALCLAVGALIVFVTTAHSEPPEMASVTGVWLLSFIPFIVTAACGASICPYAGPTHQTILLIVSFLMWSLGITMSMVVITIYFWRLTRYHLPVRDAIVSCFIPIGPCGMGAYAIQNLSVVLSHHIRTQKFVLYRDVPMNMDDAVFSAVSECINWIGVLIAMCLIGFGTFWLIQGTAAVVFIMPKSFNVGFWAFVFPVGVYANGLCQLAKDLDNEGLRGWAAFCVALTVFLWLGCSTATLYKGVWCGELFFAPGLEGWNERKWMQARDGKTRVNDDNRNAEESGEHDIASDYHQGDSTINRMSRPDGTYGLHETHKNKRAVEHV